MLRFYALFVGSVLVLLGLVGLAASAGLMVAIQTSPVTDLFHLAMGVFFLYVGSWHGDAKFVREIVGGTGVLFLFAMGLIIAVPLLWGDAPLAGLLEIVGVVVGFLSILAARYLPDGRRPPPRT